MTGSPARSDGYGPVREALHTCLIACLGERSRAVHLGSLAVAVGVLGLTVLSGSPQSLAAAATAKATSRPAVALHCHARRQRVARRHKARRCSRPQTWIVSGPSPRTHAQVAEFRFRSNDHGTFSCALDGRHFRPCKSPERLSGLAPGPHRFRVRARNQAGHVDRTPATRRWTIMSARSPAIYWGAYMEGRQTYGAGYGDAPWDKRTWRRFESHAGKHVSIVHWGMGTPWGRPFKSWEKTLNLVRDHGDINMVDLQSGNVSLRSIAAGRYDHALRAWVRQAAAWGHPFFLTWDVEMNGTWLPWGTAPGSATTPREYVAAWRHFHTLAQRAGATNITWVWCPNIDPQGRFTPYSLVYPGPRYVDWTCLDGFNSGVGGWSSFASLYSTSYNNLLALAPTKPILIGQIGSVERGGSKAGWITDALSTQLPHNFPRIKALVWFNWRSHHEGGWRAYQIESSHQAEAAFARAIASPYYAAGGAFKNLPSRSPIRPLP